MNGMETHILINNTIGYGVLEPRLLRGRVRGMYILDIIVVKKI